MQLSNAVTSVTREKIVPKVYDTITKGSPGLMYFLQNAKPWKSGTEYDVIIQYQDTTNGGVSGLADKLDTDRQETRTKLIFYPKLATKPVVVATIEKALNSGDERVLDLVATEFDTQAKSLMNILGAQLYGGNGVGNNFDSLYNAADDGSLFATYGGKPKATYTSIKGYYLASAGALTLAKLATAYDAVEVGMDKPDMILTTKSIWSSYEALLTPTVRNGYSSAGYPKMNAFGMVPTSETLKGAQGFEVLFFRGTPVIKDEQVPSGKMFLVNSNYFGFKGVDLSGSDSNIKTVNFKGASDGTPLGVPGRIPSTRGFNFRDMMSPVDQLAEVGHIIYVGDFISERSGTLGQIVAMS
jgi:hypothetical protein